MWIFAIFIAMAGGAYYQESQKPPPPAPERIVLLPNQDGSNSAVIVTSAKGENVIDKPYLSASVAKGGAITAKQEDALAVNARYGSTLSALPQRAGGYIVYFETATDHMIPESAVQFARLKHDLAQRSQPEISITAHADRFDTPGYNEELARRRAYLIAQLLVQEGIPAARITTENRADRDPQARSVDDRRNRRVEIRVR
ncbi:MAG: OmpA family protein [Pseudomonadota bacterium]